MDASTRGLCKAVTKTGARCRVRALEGSLYCYFHSPDMAAERKEARARGGRARHGRRVGETGDGDQVTGVLTVRGKRNKERIAYAVNGALDALLDWVTIRGDSPGALFWAIRKGGHVQTGQRLTTQAIYHILTVRAGRAGVKELSPHDFRRTFVGDLLDAGADISTVQRLARHASVTTTARYDRRPEAAKRKAAELLHVPYVRRTLNEEDER